MSSKKEPAKPPAEDPERSQGIDADRVGTTLDSDLVADSSVQRSGVLVGIPAYNEAGAIESVVADALNYVDEVLVVDDGSTDETAELAEKAGATVISHQQNQGYGATLQTIFNHANKAGVDCLVTIDGDAQHDVSDIDALVEAFRESDASVVIGSRFLGESKPDIPAYRRFGLTVINFLSNLAIRVRGGEAMVSDTQSGFRAYDAEAIKAVTEAKDIGLGMDASLDILFYIASRNLEIAEVPTTINYDVEGTSTHNPVIHGFSLIRSIAVEFTRTNE